MFKIGVGVGEGTDDYSVGVMAVSNAVSDLRRDRSECTPNAALVFASPKYNYDSVIRGVLSVLGDSVPIVGASTAGEITKHGPTIRESVVLMLMYSDTLEFFSGAAEKVGADPRTAGANLVQALQKTTTDQFRLLLLFPDGLTPAISDLVQSVQDAAGEKTTIVGASAGDGNRFRETYQYYQEDALTGGVSGLGITGNLTFSVGIGHGWNAVGAPRVITQAEGSRIITIDEKPAFNFYRDYLGEEVADELKQSRLGEIALSYPMGTYDEQCGQMLLRAPLHIDDDGSILCGGVLKTGAKVQLMMGSREDAMRAAKQAAQAAKDAMQGSIAGAIIFSCHIRNSIFSETHTAKHEIEMIREVIGNDVPIAGFYSYAEHAPFGVPTERARTCPTEFHNETIAVLLIGEESLQ